MLLRKYYLYMDVSRSISLLLVSREARIAKLLPTWSGPGEKLSVERKRLLQALGIDVHSCVHFLSDLLSQWTKIHVRAFDHK
jgi:hypothetical protein